MRIIEVFPAPIYPNTAHLILYSSKITGPGGSTIGAMIGGSTIGAIIRGSTIGAMIGGSTIGAMIGGSTIGAIIGGGFF